MNQRTLVEVLAFLAVVGWGGMFAQISSHSHAIAVVSFVVAGFVSFAMGRLTST